MKSILAIFLYLIVNINGDDLCEKCTCSSSADALIYTMNCNNKSLERIDWVVPNSTKILKVSFSGNPLPTLEPLPQTEPQLEVVLSKCGITYLKPALFVRTRNIKFVDLSHNNLKAEEISSEKFKGTYNETFYEPISLEHLDLSYNQIHSLGKNVFEHMPNLRILNLEGNDFRLLDIHTQLALSSIRSLQSLNLANNELTEMIVTAIESHDNLTELDLSSNLLDFVPGSLSHVGKSLEVLKIDSNPIIDFVSDTFLGLGNVIHLSANNLTKLKYINADTFAPMKKLKKLSLSNNFLLTDIDREAFGINQTLEEFYLNNNDLFRIDFKLLPWSQLHVFEFKDNPLQCSCDLYNITSALSRDITRLEDGPYCEDPRTGRYIQVFYLKSDICSYKAVPHAQKEFIEYHFSLVRIALIVLSVIVMMVALIAAVLGFVRYRKYQRQLNYPYASQIIYNPVSTSAKF